jgi:hypothetical protein
MTTALLALILGGPVAGAAIGVRYARRFGYRAMEIELDHLRGELYDAEQQMAALRYYRRAA